VRRNPRNAGKTFVRLHRIAGLRESNWKRRSHFDPTGQFARHTSVAATDHCEFSMKVFNSSVENRVEKHREQIRNARANGFFPLCTIFVQFARRLQKYSGRIALPREGHMLK
jgi:hypothetical protein